MVPALKSARYLGQHRIELAYVDGLVAAVDFSAELWGPVFEPLKDPAYFQKFKLDMELGTVTWPNGADFAPEFLYESVRAALQR